MELVGQFEDGVLVGVDEPVDYAYQVGLFQQVGDVEDVTDLGPELLSLHDVVEHLEDFLQLDLRALGTSARSHRVALRQQVLRLLILDVDELVEQVGLEMAVLLKLLELLVEDGVDGAVEAGLVAGVADVVNDQVDVGEARVVVVGAVEVDQDELEVLFFEVAVEVDQPHQFVADCVVQDRLVQDLPVYALILHLPHIGVVLYRVNARYLPRDDVLQPHEDLLLFVLP